jgi:hypothetical protein
VGGFFAPDYSTRCHEQEKAPRETSHTPQAVALAVGKRLHLPLMLGLFPRVTSSASWLLSDEVLSDQVQPGGHILMVPDFNYCNTIQYMGRFLGAGVLRQKCMGRVEAAYTKTNSSV